MNRKPRFKSAALPLPAGLADVALIDAASCAASGGMSISWWHTEVAAGRAPKPKFRMPRCTRWLMSDVRAFWIEFADRAAADTQPGARVIAQATKASALAKAKRAACVSAVGEAAA